MSGDAFVGIADAETPTQFVDNASVGTHGGLTVVRQRVESYAATGPLAFPFDSFTNTVNAAGDPDVVTYTLDGTVTRVMQAHYDGAGNLTGYVKVGP